MNDSFIKILDDADGMSDEKRLRSPNWQLHEKELLLDLIKDHYHVIESKKLDGGTHRRKHTEWALMARKFNARNVLGPRTGKELRTQWANLRKAANREEHTRLETGNTYSKNPLIERVINLMQTKLNETNTEPISYDSMPEMQDEDSGDMTLASCSEDFGEKKFDIETKVEIRVWDEANKTNSDEEQGKDSKEDVPKREWQFTARDCRLLLHCVRQEKNIIFGDTNSAKKQTAWNRVSKLFNRQSSNKKHVSELKKKFQNLKTMATKMNRAKKMISTVPRRKKKYEQLSDEGDVQKKIKSEPKSDVTDDDNMGSDMDVASQDSHSGHARNDPLSNGVSVDSGLGISRHSESNSVEKLRIELINYEMETAKLQRKRIEDAIKAEKLEQEARSLEAALRLRSARLEAVAAEAKLPPMHPALAYTALEERAREYMAFPVP